jgi:FAD dependent oxidoreductase
MHRRHFLQTTLAGLGWLTAPRTLLGREASTDVLVAGASVGGCAAALALARNGVRVILTEESDWIGGQLTQQMVPPDEHAWIEQFGATASYREYRRLIRDYYREHYPLVAEELKRPNLNPGNCSVSRLCHEPRVGVAVLEAMLAPYVSSGRVVILREHKPVSATTRGDAVESVRLRDLRSGEERDVAAAYFLDATETGDLLPMTKTEYVTGAESQAATAELHAKANAEPANMQSITWCFIMEHIDGADFTIDKPAGYDEWRNYTPALRPAWPGKLLSWATTHPVTLEPRTQAFDPRQANAAEGGLWVYRRLIYDRSFTNGAYPGSICVVNWPQNDYWLGNIIEVDEQQAQHHLDRAKQLSLALFYWMQTEAPRPGGGQGWKGLRLRPDLAGTADGLAKRPYIRESRRIAAEFTVREQHVGLEQRAKETGQPRGEIRSEAFPDSVGVGSYRIDLHPSTGGDNYIDISSLPFEIPLGALLPKRVENLLPACKNLGVTHITNGCYRLHPVEWNIGESAGLLAAYCLREKQRPRQVRNTEKLLAAFQKEIMTEGVEIRWPDPLRAPR